MEIFARMVPGTDVAIGKKAVHHISFDPRMSPAVLRAFENAEDEVLMNTLKGAPRLDVPGLFRPGFMAEVEKEHPEYFADLPKLTLGQDRFGLGERPCRELALFGQSVRHSGALAKRANPKSRATRQGFLLALDSGPGPSGRPGMTAKK